MVSAAVAPVRRSHDVDPFPQSDAGPSMQDHADSSWLPRPLVWLKWGLAGAAVAGLWLSLNYATLNEYFDARARRNEAKRTVHAMDQQYQQLQTERRELEMWGFTAEKAIRERLKMARPGEQVIIIDAPRGSVAISDGSPAAADESAGDGTDR
jgi:hypothetical protein